MTDKKIEELEQRLKALEESMDDKKEKTVVKKEKKTRKPSAYNEFIGKTIKELKSKNEKLTHKEAFSEAVKEWNKNKKK